MEVVVVVVAVVMVVMVVVVVVLVVLVVVIVVFQHPSCFLHHDRSCHSSLHEEFKVFGFFTDKPQPAASAQAPVASGPRHLGQTLSNFWTHKALKDAELA